MRRQEERERFSLRSSRDRTQTADRPRPLRFPERAFPRHRLSNNALRGKRHLKHAVILSGAKRSRRIPRSYCESPPRDVLASLDMTKPMTNVEYIMTKDWADAAKAQMRS